MSNQSPLEIIESAINEVSLELTDRERLLSDLARVRDLAFKKIEMRNTENKDKIAWARLIVSSCGTTNSVLKDKENDDILRRIESAETCIKDLRTEMGSVG